MTSALLVIDLQRYFLEVGPEAKRSRVGTLIARTNDLIDLFHEKRLPVVRVQTLHKADGSTWNQAMRPHWTGAILPGTLIEGTGEAQWHPDLHARPTDIVVTKTRGSAFLRTDLDERLAGLAVGRVVLAGFSTDRCVGLTAIDAWERDLQVLLAGDAILATNPAEGQMMLDYLKRSFGIGSASNDEVARIVSG